MIIQIETNNIDVFPISKPRPSMPGARVLSEVNLRKLIRGCTDYPSYVISENYSQGTPFEFVIDGYYCKIDAPEGQYPFNITEITHNTTKTLYAQITFEEASLDTYNPVLDIKETTLNNKTILEGIKFIIDDDSYTADPNSIIFPILIIKDVDGNLSYTIPLESKVRFKRNSFLFDEVDGGEIL